MSWLRSLRPAPRIQAAVVAAACAVAGLHLGLGARDERRLRDATRDAAAGRFEAATARAAEVTTPPAGGRARLLTARVLVDQGRPRAALEHFRAAARRDPSDWMLHRDWAVALLAAGDRRQAQRRLEVALARNRLMELPPGFRDRPAE